VKNKYVEIQNEESLEFPFTLLSRFHLGENSYTQGLLLYIKLNSKKIPIVLRNECNETFVPRRIHPYLLQDKKVWVFDNLRQSILVDKHQVTNREIYEWEAITLKEKKHDDAKKWHLPAIDLSSTEMREYCKFKGKHLMTAQIFDAMTFRPSDTENPLPITIKASPYPWTWKEKSEELYKYQEGKLTKLCFQANYIEMCLLPELGYVF